MIEHFLKNTLLQASKISEEHFNHRTFVGLDGYIDLIQRVVKNQAADGPEYFETISDFAQHLQKAAGKSAQVELITQEKKLGGNAPIMAHALGTFGFFTSCVGNFGESEVDEVFNAIDGNVRLLSVGSPAMTNALEFHDGKLILSEVGPFKIQSWNYIKNKVGTEPLLEEINKSTLVALVDWCNLPFSTDTWKGILEDILPETEPRDRYFFFDIADPSRRSDEEISEALSVIGEYCKYGKVTLGLNENETEKLCSCLIRINHDQERGDWSLIDKAKYIFEHINVWNLLVHPTDRAISVQQERIVELPGRVVSKPKISTGGGDNFNAGYCCGQMFGFGMEECMIAGMATSGSYVEFGKSPGFGDLKIYIENWLNELK